MSFAIISNVEKTDNKYTIGKKMIRKIVLIEDTLIQDDLGEEYYIDPTEATESPIGEYTVIDMYNPSLSNYEKAILDYINLTLGEVSLGIVENGLYLRKIDDCKFELMNSTETKRTNWLGYEYTEIKNTYLGKYYCIEMQEDYKVDSTKIAELTFMLSEIKDDHTAVLSQSISFEHQVNDLTRENDFLKVIIGRFERDVNDIKNTRTEDKMSIEQRMIALEDKIAHFATERQITPKRITTIRDIPRHPLETSIASLVANFDRSKLRPISMTMSRM
jgi:predicted  nucleic acid-binding Zn-ribbon protein